MIRALVTVYNPSDGVKENLSKISAQADEVFICDNSAVNNEEFLETEKYQNVKYYFFGENLGLSKAFNRILRAFDWNCEDFIIFFDQDSSIAEDHIQKLTCEYEALENAGVKVGCLGPAFFNISSGQVELPKMKKALNDHSFRVSCVITSSMLCRYQVLKDIGFWNDRVFLDLADWDLCWRSAKSGYTCCMTDCVTFTHVLGKGERRIGKLRIREGSAFREYYQTRECLYLLTKGYTPLKFRVRFLAMLTVRPIIHILFLDEKRARIKYILKGIGDFFKKKDGPINENK